MAGAWLVFSGTYSVLTILSAWTLGKMNRR